MVKKGLKAEKTRAAILDATLSLILEEGYEKATMRAIAKKAGLSPGAAYYYFETKEHIIQAFYELTFEKFIPLGKRIVGESENLAEGISGLLEAQFRTSAPYHGVSRLLFRAALDPDSSLSPFSEATASLRNRSVGVYRDLLLRHAPKAMSRTRGTLPLILWFYHMAMVAFWVYDKTPGQERTFRFIQRTSGFVTRLVQFATLKIATPLVGSGLVILEEFPLVRSYMQAWPALKEEPDEAPVEF